MDNQMIVIGIIILALFIVPYGIVQYYAVKRKQKIKNAVRVLIQQPDIEFASIVEVTEWAFYLDEKRGRLAVIDKKNLDVRGVLVEVSILKGCSITSESEAGNIVLLDLILSFKDGVTADMRFTFYKFSTDAHSEAHNLQRKAEGLQSQIRSCM